MSSLSRAQGVSRHRVLLLCERDFNANDFFNNRTGLAKPKYRYNTVGGLGGPIYIQASLTEQGQVVWFLWLRALVDGDPRNAAAGNQPNGRGTDRRFSNPLTVGGR
jgi:hypothetical protein